MYSIEYFKTKRNKPEIKEPEYNSQNRLHNLKNKRRYLYQKDLIDKCWNIKSVIIDLDDVRKVIFDDNCRHLLFLYARICCIDTSNISTITILNNNQSNKLCIYELLNCNWMINKNECVQNFDDIIIEKEKELNKLISLYENSSDKYIKDKIKKKILLLNHYINSINSIKKQNKQDGKSLILGTHFKRTI